MNKYPVIFASGGKANLDYYLERMMEALECGPMEIDPRSGYSRDNFKYYQERYFDVVRANWVKSNYLGRMMSLDEVARNVYEGGMLCMGFVFDGESIIIYDDYME